MACLGDELRSFCHFWDGIQVLHCGLLVDSDGYSISSKGFLHTVVDIMVIQVIHPFQIILVHWFLKCGCSLLPSPVWPLPIFLDSWTYHSRFLCNIALQHQTLLPSSIISTAGCCFCFGSVSSFFPELFLHWSPIAYWAPNDLGSSSFGIPRLYQTKNVSAQQKEPSSKWKDNLWNGRKYPLMTCLRNV